MLIGFLLLVSVFTSSVRQRISWLPVSFWQERGNMFH